MAVLWLQSSILCRWSVTGTVLGHVRKFAVTHDAGVGIRFCEILQQLVEGVLLGFSASVNGYPFLIKASFIDNAKGTVIVVPGMYALDTFRQQRDDVAITADIIMVTALAVFGLTAGNQVFHTERKVALRGGTVNNQEFYGFQWFHFSEHGLHTTLDGQGAGDGGYHGSYDFQHLPNGAPFYFDHLRFLYKIKHGL